MNINDLKNDLLCDLGPNGHHLATLSPEVGNVGAACNLIFDSLSGQMDLQYADAFTK